MVAGGGFRSLVVRTTITSMRTWVTFRFLFWWWWLVPVLIEMLMGVLIRNGGV